MKPIRPEKLGNGEKEMLLDVTLIPLNSWSTTVGVHRNISLKNGAIASIWIVKLPLVLTLSVEKRKSLLEKTTRLFMMNVIA